MKYITVMGGQGGAGGAGGRGGNDGEDGQPGEPGAYATRSRAEIVVLLALSAMLAASFAWLFYQQRQASQRNTALIAQIQQLTIDGCYSAAKESRALRKTLITLRDSHFVFFTPAQEALRIKTYDRLLRIIPIQKCARAVSTLPRAKKGTS